MQINSISIFRSSLKDICKRPKHSYTSCPEDICEELKDKRVQDLVTTNNAIIHDDGVKCLLKVRIACASRKVGKSGGFRLLVIANRETQEVVLLDIYPKVGPLGKSNIDSNDLKRLIEVYITERANEKLVLLDIENKLTEKPEV